MCMHVYLLKVTYVIQPLSMLMQSILFYGNEEWGSHTKQVRKIDIFGIIRAIYVHVLGV